MSPQLLIFDELPLAPRQYARAVELAPLWRRRKAEVLVSDTDRQLSLVAGLLLVRALGGALLPPVVEGTRGKPRFAHPGFPRFSLSHCRRAVACAVAEGHDVGVDVEELAQYAPEVAAEVCSAAELAAIGGDPAEFARVWTRKESYLKWLGTGLDGDLRAIPPAAGVHRIATFTSAKGYACSVCSSHPAISALRPRYMKFTDLI